MASGAGVLWVSSKIVEPGKLSVKEFDNWYENVRLHLHIHRKKETTPASIHQTISPNTHQEHALEVLSLPGIPSGIRYAATSPPASSPHLITYEFPDLSYTTTPAFQAVANQALSQQLIDRIYAHASFDIRFYAELPTPSPPLAAPHHAPSHPDANLALASITLSPADGKEAEFLLWFARDLLEGLSNISTFVRARRFEFVNGVVRERNVVSTPGAPRYLVLAKFEGGVQGVKEEVERLVGKGPAGVDIGWFDVKKVWAEGDVEKIAEQP